MNLTETIKATPLQTVKSVRTVPHRGITSGKAGKSIPIAYTLLHREDRVSRGQMMITSRMLETYLKLSTGVRVTAYAYFVPHLAHERFAGLDMLNASYQGVELRPGDGVVPFFDTMTYNTNKKVLTTLGVHAADGATINRLPVEAYNAIWNYRARARSTKLEPRGKNDATLAPAFWNNQQLAAIVPDFDQAMIDGEVDLSLAAVDIPVKGVGVKNSGVSWAAETMKETGGNTATGTVAGGDELRILQDATTGFPAIYAELAQQGMTLSLSNIEMAKKTAAFARIRKKMAGLDDDAIIDLLMEGIRVPDAQMSQPILLDRKSTVFGYNERYATDAGNLDQSRTSGMAPLHLRWRTPPMNTGGVIMVTVEVVPEQMNERMMDPGIHVTDVAELPNFTRDYLDPEKVDIVKNKQIDVQHSLPDATFGYEPLNNKWKRGEVRVGGKFFKRLNDPWHENRQRFWSVDTVDQTLTEDFYLVPDDLPHTVFEDQISDPFEFVSRGENVIVGNTVFGKGLQENTEDYADIIAQVDTGQIDQTA